MKHYEVVFSPAARIEAIEAAEYIARDAPDAAARWLEGLEKFIDGLSSFPKRCAIAPESEFLGQELSTSRLLFPSHYLPH